MADSESSEAYAASFEQRQLWFLAQLVPASTAYVILECARLDSGVDAGVLATALDLTRDRHETLRTTYATSDGEPVQLIHDPGGLPPVLEVAEAAAGGCRPEEKLAAWVRTPFNLRKQTMMRAVLIREDNGWLFALAVHHIAADGWSMGIILRDLTEFYDSIAAGRRPRLGEIPVGYADFASWQRSGAAAKALAPHLEYFVSRLAGAPEVLALPLDRPRPALQSFSGSYVTFTLDRQLVGELSELGRQRGATLFMVLLAIFKVLLARYSGQADIVVGVPAARRSQREAEAVVGLFANTLALRTDLSGDLDFSAVLDRVRDGALDALSHQELPFEMLVERLAPAREPSHNPIFQVFFALQNIDVEAVRLRGVRAQPFDVDGKTSKFDLSLDFTETGAGHKGTLEYDDALFERATAEAMSAQYERLCRLVVENPAWLIADMPMLDAGERDAVLAAGAAPADTAPGSGVLAQFTAQVAARPGAVAVRCGDTSMTYAELDRAASLIARQLRARSLGADDLVAVCLPRSPRLVAALIGAFMAGCAYVPVDPAYPDDRIGMVLRHCGARVVVTESTLGGRLAAASGGLPAVLADALAEGEPAVTATPGPCWPANLAYVIYTSGSTGTPKGVMVEHDALRNLLASFAEELGADASMRLLAVTTVSFDIAALEIFLPLTAGGTLVLATEEQSADPVALAALMDRVRANVMQATPATWRMLMQQGCPRLDAALVGGEPLPDDVAAFLRSLAPKALNVYGPTETTIWSSKWRLAPGAPAIGVPIAETRLCVLTSGMQVQPPGALGELHIGGRGVSRGYLHQPAATAERFVPDPFGPSGAVLYRTGDLVRLRRDGQLEFHGRLDDQVKVRGFRIELAEIEETLRQEPLVADAAAVVSADGAAIAAFIVSAPAPELAGPGERADTVSRWAAVWDTAYAGGAPPRQSADYSGWRSSYTGAEFSDSVMGEWADGTAAAVLALAPDSVLDIGCGTGLLYWRLAGRLSRYSGLDLSASAIERLAGNHAPGTQFTVGSAMEVTAAGEFDVVVLNSVVQYFPDLSYLQAVLERAIRACGPGGAVFIGDVRSLRLLPAFHLSLLAGGLTQPVPDPASRDRLEAELAREEELVIDPDFFVRLAAAHGWIAAVTLKPGVKPTEMNLFRYDVVLRAPGPDCLSRDMLRRVAWRDRAETALADLLAGPRDEPVLLAGVPHPWLQPWAQGAQRDGAGGDAGASGVLPWKLRETLHDSGFTVRCAPAAAGYYDAVISRTPAAAVASADSGTGGPLANQPVLQEYQRQLADAMRARIRLALPEYMVPSVLTFVPGLPRTPNGKLDRGSLRRLTARPATMRRFVAPRTGTERTVAETMGSLLGESRIGIEDDFFALGGHSVLATRLLARVRKVFGVSVPLREFFASPTSAGLAALIDSAANAAGRADSSLVRHADRSRALPVTMNQQRLWFVDQIGQASSAYLLYDAVRLTGDVDVAALRAALRELVRRHEALRTAFETRDGRLVQCVRPASQAWEVLHVTGDLPADRAHAELSQRLIAPFDLADGRLLRGVLVPTPGGGLFGLSTHHIAADGWSMGILLRELAEYYESFRAGREPDGARTDIDYADFVTWQAGDAGSRRHVDYWREHLAGAPEFLPLPVDRQRPGVQSFRGERAAFTVSAQTVGKLQGVGRAAGATLFMTILAAFKVLLARVTDSSDIVIGTAVAGRSVPELEDIVGFFVNTVVIRTRVDGRATFAEVLARVRDAALGAYEHQGTLFEVLLDSLSPPRDLAYNPLFQVMFTLREQPEEGVQLAGCSADRLPLDTHTSKFDLSVHINVVDGSLEGVVEYDSALFDRESVERLVDCYLCLLEAAAADPRAQVSRLALLPDSQRARVLELSRGPRVPVAGDCVHDLVAAVAARSPDAIAVVGAARTLTFRELDERANGLARQLLASGVRGDTAVAVYAHRSPELVIALLAVLKAGAAYFPVDPAYPPDRVASAIRSSRSPVILTEAGLAAGLPRTDSGGEWPHLLLGQEPRCPDAPDVSVDPLSLAYVIYTSGSTGTPKSAMLTHEALRNLCSWLQRFFGHGPADRVAMLASVSFDGLAWEIWPHLSVGAALCVVDDRTRAVPSELVAFFARQRITRCFLPTGLAQVMAEQEWPPDAALKVVFAGGDRLHWPSRSRSWLLYNHYGPTEATVVMTGTLAEPGPGKRDAPTLGRAIDNVQAYVLDANLELLPIGVPGELHIGGACLGRGYAGMPGLTADSWIPDPFGPPGGVLYRTGDIVRLLPDGDLDFVSRADQQVKIRGYRVEPGEIEAVCRKHPLVADALVLAVDTPASGRQLTAYLAGDLPEQGVAEVRGFVREQLPDYMVPARWHVLAAFPLTSNGKVDHRALPAAARDGAYRQAALVPREATGRQSVQQRVARVWEAVLGTSQLMPEDSFFEVGGNSLLLTKLAECLRTEFAVPVGLMDIFACPTIATQAEFLDKASGQPAPDRGPSQGGTAAGDVASARLAARQRRAQRRGGTE